MTLSLQDRWVNDFYGQFGNIAAIDLNRRTVLEVFDIAVHLSQARVVLERAADFEDERIVSWGRLTLNEIRGLFACVQTDYIEVYQEQLLEYEQLLSYPERYTITFYYYYNGL
jgi:hypothetical protein